MDTSGRTVKEMSPQVPIIPDSISDVSRSELLSVIHSMERELEEREISIANLKAEKAKQLFYQAKYGRFGLSDPFMMLQRDNAESGDKPESRPVDEGGRSAVCYDNQRGQLETLIINQRRAQQRMIEQMENMDKKFKKVCAELQEERRKHEKDAAQGDDVLVMLEKERERLKSEVDYEHGNLRKVEKEFCRNAQLLESERQCSAKQRRVAQLLMRERKALTEALVQQRQRAMLLEKLLADTQTKVSHLQNSVNLETDKTATMEGNLRKRIQDCENERDQLRAKLAREEIRHKEMTSELQQLRVASTGRRATPPDPPIRRTPSAIPQPKATSNVPPVLTRVSVGTSPSQQRRTISAVHHHHPVPISGGPGRGSSVVKEKPPSGGGGPSTTVKAVTVNGK